MPAQWKEDIVVFLTANTTIGEWLAHPFGGEVVRNLLAQTGTSESSVEPLKALPLQQLVVLSRGKIPRSVIEDIVVNVNGGRAPEPGPAPG